MTDDAVQPQGYLPRVVDEQVERYLRIFGAVEIAGTKWCGKTWTSLKHGKSVTYVDQFVDQVKSQPSLALIGEKPHVIDEWQIVPSIWDVVRHEVDKTRGCHSSWILTGSSTPLTDEEAPYHSGAGRIGRIRMHPMSLSESGDSSGEVSLSGLFRGKFSSCKADGDIRHLARLIVKGGWPEAVDMAPEDAQAIAEGYLDLLLESNMSQHGGNPNTARRLLASLARNDGQSITYKTIQEDMFGEDGQAAVTDKTITWYMHLLKSMYVIDEVNGWVPPRRSPKRLRTKPKRYLADPSLAAAQLGISPEALIDDWQTMGLLFENLCMRDLMVYAGAIDNGSTEPIMYYRDDTGLEVDAIIELKDGRWAAIETELSEDKVSDAVRNLRRLKKKLCENEHARVRPPEFMAVLCGASSFAREVDEGVFVIPITALGK